MADANRIDFTNQKPFTLTECPLTAGEENADILLDYCNRKLAPDMAAVFELHMSKCPACSAFAESQMAVWSALDSFETMPISEDFDQRLWARIERDQQGSWWNRLWNRVTNSGMTAWRPVIPVLAILLLAVGLWVRPSFLPFTNPDAPVAKGDHVDVEQVETALEDLEMLRQFSVPDSGGAPQQKM